MCRVLQVGGRLDLGEEAFGADDRGELRPQHLQRDLPLVLQVVGHIDGRHPACTDLTLDTISAFECRVQAGYQVGRTHAARCELLHRSASDPNLCRELGRYPPALTDAADAGIEDSKACRTPPPRRRPSMKRGVGLIGHVRRSRPLLRSRAGEAWAASFLRSPETRLLYSSVSHVAMTMRCRNSGVSASSWWASKTRRSGPPLIETNQAPSMNSGPPPGTGATFPRYRRSRWMNSMERTTSTSLDRLQEQTNVRMTLRDHDASSRISRTDSQNPLPSTPTFHSTPHTQRRCPGQALSCGEHATRTVDSRDTASQAEKCIVNPLLAPRVLAAILKLCTGKVGPVHDWATREVRPREAFHAIRAT